MASYRPAFFPITAMSLMGSRVLGLGGLPQRFRDIIMMPSCSRYSAGTILPRSSQLPHFVPTITKADLFICFVGKPKISILSEYFLKTCIPTKNKAKHEMFCPCPCPDKAMYLLFREGCSQLTPSSVSESLVMHDVPHYQIPPICRISQKPYNHNKMGMNIVWNILDDALF